MGYRQMDLKSSVMLLFLRMNSVRSRFLGAFEILRNATISFAMSLRLYVCPSVPHGTVRLPLEGLT